MPNLKLISEIRESYEDIGMVGLVVRMVRSKSILFRIKMVKEEGEEEMTRE
jgi:hypothetical protein